MRRERKEVHWSEYPLSAHKKAFKYKAFPCERISDFDKLMKVLDKKEVSFEKLEVGFFNTVQTRGFVKADFIYFYRQEDDQVVEEGKIKTITYPKYDKTTFYFFPEMVVTKAKKAVAEVAFHLLQDTFTIGYKPKKFTPEIMRDLAGQADIIKKVKFAKIRNSELDNLTTQGFFDNYIPANLRQAELESAELKSFTGVYQSGTYGRVVVQFNTTGQVTLRGGKGNVVTAGLVCWSLDFFKGFTRDVSWKTEQEENEMSETV